MSRRNLWLDLFKLFLSFLVICIHFIGNTYWHYPIYRLAVPTFFMISGYFLYSKDENKRIDKAKQFIKRTFKYLLIGFGIYIVYDFIMCYIDGKGVGYYFTTLFYQDFLFEFFFLNRPITYSGYQLWFLIALLTLSLIHFSVLKFKKEKWYYLAIPICLVIYLFFSGYMHLFQETDMPIRYTRNAWFMGLPLFSIGYITAQYDFHKKAWYKYLYLGLGIFFFFFQTIERYLVGMEMYISTVLSATFLLQFFISLKPVKADWFYKWFGKSMYFYIYIFHVAVGITLGRIFDYSNLYVKAIGTFIICVVLYECCYLIYHLIMQKKRSIKTLN